MQQLFSYYYATFHLLDGPLSWKLGSVSSKWAGPYAHRSTHLLDTLPSIPASVPFNRFFVEYVGLAHKFTRLSIIALGRLVKGSEHTYTSRKTGLNQRPTWNYKRETLSSHWSSTGNPFVNSRPVHLTFVEDLHHGSFPKLQSIDSTTLLVGLCRRRYYPFCWPRCNNFWLRSKIKSQANLYYTSLLQYMGGKKRR